MRVAYWVCAAAFFSLSAVGVGAQTALPTSPSPQKKTPASPPLATPRAADGAASAEPQSTSAVYGDWVLRCNNNVGPQKQKVCELNQSLVDQNNTKIAEIALGRMPDKDKSAGQLRIVVLLGNNVAFANPVKLASDDKEPNIELTYRRCIPVGCFADALFTDEIAGRWRPRVERGRLTYLDGANREIALPFSLRGFAQALEALAKS